MEIMYNGGNEEAQETYEAATPLEII